MEKAKYFGIELRISREPTPEEHVALRKAPHNARAALLRTIEDSQEIFPGLMTRICTIDNRDEALF